MSHSRAPPMDARPLLSGVVPLSQDVSAIDAGVECGDNARTLICPNCQTPPLDKIMEEART